MILITFKAKIFLVNVKNNFPSQRRVSLITPWLTLAEEKLCDQVELVKNEKGWKSHIWIDGWHITQHNATHKTEQPKKGKIFSWIRWIHKALFAFSWFEWEKFFKYSFQWVISPNKNILGDWNFLLRSEQKKKERKTHSTLVSWEPDELTVAILSVCFQQIG